MEEHGETSNSLKLGFQIKVQKRKRINVESNNDDQKDLIKCIEGRVIAPVNAVDHSKQLVIPLRNVSGVLSDNSKTLSIDEQAAAELVCELSGEKVSSTSELLILQNKSKNGSLPMLLANQPKELLGLKDDDERFKVDLSLRPDEVDVKSEIYEKIPIEEFGAAMLRGMGWTGPSEEDTKKVYDINPREYRLGLGALPKPPDEKGPGDKKKKEEKKKEWMKKANDLLKNQTFEDGDLVWLRDPMYAGRRARVIASRGVPGLDRIRLQLESDSRIVELKRTDAVILTSQELEEKPYLMEVGNSSTNVTMATSDMNPRDNRYTNEQEKNINNYYENKSIQDMNRNKNSNKEKNQERDRDRNWEAGRNRDSDRNRNSDQDRHNQPKSEQYQDNIHNKDKEYIRKQEKEIMNISRGRLNTDEKLHMEKSLKDTIDDEEWWIRSGIRVRVISKKVTDSTGTSVYLKKGKIISIGSKKGVATIQLEESIVIYDVKQKYLETVLPSLDGQGLIVKGKYCNQKCILLEKKKDKEEVIVKLLPDITNRSEVDREYSVKLSMDALAALS